MGSVHDLTQEGKSDRIGIVKLPLASCISVCNLKPITAQTEVGGEYGDERVVRKLSIPKPRRCAVLLSMW